MSSILRRSLGASLRAASSRLWAAHLRSYSSSCMRARITAKLSAARIDSPSPVASFNDLVGAGENAGRNGDADRISGSQVDNQLEPCWLLHRQIGWIGALQD